MNDFPLVTVILPIRNESRYIEKGLLSLLSQDYWCEKLEIIIVDGMSTDNTLEILDRILNAHPKFSIKIIDNPKKIVPTGMNIAIPHAKGEIIVRIDGHCEIDSQYIRNCLEELSNPEVWGVGGPIDTIGENFIAEGIAIAMSSYFGVGGSAFRTIKDKKILVDTVAFPAYRKEVFEMVGLFDEELVRNQDDEFNYRIREAGGKILLSPKIHSKYFSRGSLGKLFKQYYQYGFWKVRILQKHPRQMRLRQFIPPAFVLSLFISALLVFIPGLEFAAALIPILYIVVNIIFSIYISCQKGWRFILLLPVVFITLHISYGLGFIGGLVKFWNRWGDKIGTVPSFESS